MPALETMDLYGRALLWRFLRWDEYAQPVVSASPESIPVRWVNKKYEVVNAKTGTLALDAQVVVDRAVTVGSLLWQVPDPASDGLDQWNGTGSGTGDARDDELMQVKLADRADDVRGRFTRSTLGCMRFGNSLPTQE